MLKNSRIHATTIRFTAAGAAAFIIYLCTLAPGIRFWDSAELVSAAYSAGIPHPPGFPLYTMLGRALIALGLAEPAFTMNLFSAVCGTFSVILVLSIFQNLNEGRESPAGYFASAIYAFGSFLWMQSTRTEVYTLTILSLLLTLHFFVKYNKEGQKKWLYAGLYFWSLTFVTHSAIASAALIPLIFAGFNRKNITELRLRDVLTGIAIVIAGLSSFLYLHIRGNLNPVIKWGEPETLNGFWSMITVREFAFSINFENLMSLSERLSNLWLTLNENFSLILALLAIIGIWIGRKHLFLILLFIFGIIIVVIRENLPPPDLRGYLLPVVFTASIWAGFTFDSIIDLLKKLMVRVKTGGRISGILSYFAILIFAVCLIFANFPGHNLRGNIRAEQFGREILGSVPDSSIIVLTDVSSHFICQYLQTVEKVRTDVDLIMLPALDGSSKSRDWYLKRLENRTSLKSLSRLPETQTQIAARLIETNKDERNIFFEYGENIRPFVNYLVPHGLLYRLDLMKTDSVELEYMFPNPEDFGSDKEAASIYSARLYARSLYYQDRGEFEQSMEFYNKAIELAEK